jgi:hypothetical protein
VTLVHQQQRLWLDGEVSASHSDAADHIHAVLLKRSELPPLKLQNPMQPFEVI